MFDLGDLFRTPAYLLGLAAALIPLLIHLSRSRRTKKMRFSTTRFFTDQFLRSYRMSRLKELALLACRMALFALLAMALAQPFFQFKGATSSRMKGARAVVLVLDDSASMAYREKDETLFDRARQAAQGILDGLGPDDRASVVLAGRRANGPEVLSPQFPQEMSEVRQALDRVDVAALGTDMTAALAVAERMTREAPQPNREVYVLSDLQASGWTEADEDKPSDPARVSFVFVRVGPRQPATNRAVTAVRYASARPMVGVPFAIRPLISIRGEDGVDVVARLYVDGEKVGEQRVEKQPNGRWAMPRFYHTFTAGGWHSGHVEVEDAAMPSDNRRYFAVQVLDTVKVLAVNGAPSRVARLDELFFLRLALTASPEGQKSPFEIDTVATTALAGAELGKYPLVILANVESLPAAAVERLEEYVEKGGSLLVFLGDKVNASFYNESLAGANLRHGGLLPGRLKAIEGDAAGPDIAFIGGADYDHPALAPFADARSSTLVGPSVTFKALWRVEAPPPSLRMKASNGAPLLCEKSFGEGRVMLFASTCDRDWTNFPIRPVFLPWTHRLIAYLAQQRLGHQPPYLTGDVVRLPSSAGDSGTPLLVKKPNGAVASAHLVSGEPLAFAFADTSQPGIYTLIRPDQKGPIGLFAVNLDGYESDLTSLGDPRGGEAAELPASEREANMLAALRSRWDRPVMSYSEVAAEEGERVTGTGFSFELWRYVLFAVLLIGLFEPWLANRISARLYGRPRAAPEVGLPGVSRTAHPLAPSPVEREKVEGRR